MSAIDQLLSRKSHNRLIAPAPSHKEIKTMMQAALRAPDHALLKPWRYRIFSGDSLKQLGEHFVKASLDSDPELSSDKVEKIRNKPLRAPMVIVASVVIKPHPKVPDLEQILSAGASVQNLIMTAHFLNIGAIWRTGSLAFNRLLMDELGMSSNESIVGFIYLGQEQGEKKPVPFVDQQSFVQWV